jgi:hypothetical protein
VKQTAKSLFNDLTLMKNVIEVFTNLLEREEVNPRHPAFPTKPRYEVAKFERPVCTAGAAYFVVKPEGSTSGRKIAVCTREVAYYIRIDVMQDTLDNKGFDDFMEAVSKIEAMVREGGESRYFETGSISATLPEGEVTVAAPFNLKDIGISSISLSSRSTPRKIQSGNCSPWMASMLAVIRLHFYAE